MAGKYIVLQGPPGSGKTTQANRLHEKLDLPVISSSGLLKRYVVEHPDTEKSHLIEQIMREGKLGVDDIIIPLVAEAIEQYPDGAIFDGFPRNLRQAIALDRELLAQGKQLSAVIALRYVDAKLSCERTVLNRVDEHRIDDTPEVAAKRFEIYERDTAPLLEYYGKPPKTILYEIDAPRPVAKVSSDVDACLNPRARAARSHE